MSRLLGQFVTRAWPIILAAWVAILVGVWFGAPAWERVGKSGQFAYLPNDAPTRRAEVLFDGAFPGQRTGSGIVLVATRPDGRELEAADRRFVADVLAPRLKQRLLPGGTPEPGSPVVRIRAPGDGPTGALLESGDRRAALVAVELLGEFLDTRNWPTVAAVEEDVVELRERGEIPAGLDLALTGSAVLGRDTGQAEARSAVAVQKWTILVVVGLLLVVYRAPLLAAIPLVTVFVAIEVALRLLGLLSEVADLNLNQGTRVYVTVVGYGAGVDYCLFLIARCREEWQSGSAATAGVRVAVAKVGPAVTASAATVVVGVAMMGFADFGKIRQAGLAIAFSLTVVLTAALTLAPALLCLTGRWALWPGHAARTPGADGRVERFWGWVGRRIARRPGTVWAATVALMLPLAAVGVARTGTVSYDLTRNVPADAPSAAGLQRLRNHYPSGATGPVTVLMQSSRVDFRTPEGTAAVGEVTRRLQARAEELGLADVRSLADPLGTTPTAKEVFARIPPAAADNARDQAVHYYVGSDGRVTRAELILTRDPFSGPGLQDLGEVERALLAELPDGADVQLLGPAAGMRDVQAVTTRDRRRVDGLVVAAVFAVLLVLLRRPVLSGYLILTVVFGYLTTLGATHLLFEALEPGSFPGLDWKVPFFLFTILVAVGEDYNIFLLTRVREEQERHGAAAGVTAALGKIGGVITSCGLVMAGTFAALLAASLSEMVQMGFALSSGILLDTLVVRPVLVPAFLLLAARWRSRSAKQRLNHRTELQVRTG